MEINPTTQNTPDTGLHYQCDHNYVSNNVELTSVEDDSQVFNIIPIEVTLNEEQKNNEAPLVKNENPKVYPAIRLHFGVKENVSLVEVPGLVVALGPTDRDGLSHGMLYTNCCPLKGLRSKAVLENLLKRVGVTNPCYINLVKYQAAFDTIQSCLSSLLEDYELFTSEINRWCYMFRVKYKNKLLPPLTEQADCHDRMLSDLELSSNEKCQATPDSSTDQSSMFADIPDSFESFVSCLRTDLRGERSKRWVFYLNDTTDLNVEQQSNVTIGIASHTVDGCAMGMIAVAEPEYRFSIRENRVKKILRKAGIDAPSFLLPVANNSAYPCIQFCLRPFVVDDDLFEESVKKWCELFDVKPVRNYESTKEGKRKHKLEYNEKVKKYIDLFRCNSHSTFADILSNLKKLLEESSSERFSCPRSRRWIFLFHNTSGLEMIKFKGTVITVGPTLPDGTAYGIIRLKEPTYPLLSRRSVAKKAIMDAGIEPIMMHHVFFNFSYQFVLFCLKSLKDNVKLEISKWCTELGIPDRQKKEPQDDLTLCEVFSTNTQELEKQADRDKLSDEYQKSVVKNLTPEVSKTANQAECFDQLHNSLSSPNFKREKVKENKNTPPCTEIGKGSETSQHPKVSTLPKDINKIDETQIKINKICSFTPNAITPKHPYRISRLSRSQCWVFSVILMRNVVVREVKGVCIKVGPTRPNSLPNGIALINTTQTESLSKEVVRELLEQSNISKITFLKHVNSDSVFSWISFCLLPLCEDKNLHEKVKKEWCEKFGIGIHNNCSKPSMKIQLDKRKVPSQNTRLITVPLITKRIKKN